MRKALLLCFQFNSSELHKIEYERNIKANALVLEDTYWCPVALNSDEFNYLKGITILHFFFSNAKKYKINSYEKILKLISKTKEPFYSFEEILYFVTTLFFLRIFTFSLEKNLLRRGSTPYLKLSRIEGVFFLHAL